MLETFVYSVVFFVASGTVFTVAELARPARAIPYRDVIVGDLVALGIYGLVIFPAALYVSGLVAPDRSAFLLRSLLDLPLTIRVATYMVFIDFAMYWLHRLLHSPQLWRIHRWHHSPRQMYWLAGIRGTFPQEVLYTLPSAFALPLLHHAPPWVFLAIFATGFVSNDWMHMNVTWRSRWLEWIVVTPRYHHVHHANNPAVYTMNLGTMLTIWDRMFGTYVDPETVGEITFGIDGHDSVARLALGL